MIDILLDKMKSVFGLMLIFCVVLSQVLARNGMPPPWSVPLKFGDQGSKVVILQNLLARDVCCPSLQDGGQFDNDTLDCVSCFQKRVERTVTGELDADTAQDLLDMHMSDGYEDDGKVLPGYLYKVHIPVFRNRSVEVVATLYDSEMTAHHHFIVRTHGQNIPGTDIQLNMLSGGGDTPTGLGEFDLNSPEGNPKLYGPYPVNRLVNGLEGNMKFLVQNDVTKMIRDGLLMHTGEWEHWDPSQPMPNSHGCIHGHPEDIKTVWNILVDDLNVAIRNNTGGKLPYPNKPQGLLSIEQMD